MLPPPIGSGLSRITVDAVTDLPEPLSPTRQTISPGITSRLRPRTAWARSPPFGRATLRSRMLSTGVLLRASFMVSGPQPLFHARIERVAQAVAENVDGEEDRKSTRLNSSH